MKLVFLMSPDHSPAGGQGLLGEAPVGRAPSPGRVALDLNAFNSGPTFDIGSGNERVPVAAGASGPIFGPHHSRIGRMS